MMATRIMVPSPASVSGAAAESRVRHATPASATADAVRVFFDNPLRSPANKARNGTKMVCNCVRNAARDAVVYRTPSNCSVLARKVHSPNSAPARRRLGVSGASERMSFTAVGARNINERSKREALKTAAVNAHGSVSRNLYTGGSEPHRIGTSSKAKRGFMAMVCPKSLKDTGDAVAEVSVITESVGTDGGVGRRCSAPAADNRTGV